MRYRPIAATAGLLSLAACAAPAAGPVCAFNKMADLPVTYTGRNLPVITAIIAGQPVQMLVDSGAAVSFLTPHSYDALNLVDWHSIAGSYAMGASGNMQTNGVVLQDVHLGVTTVKDDVLIISDFGVNQADRKLGGLIGEDVLKPFDIAFDLPDNLITLYKPANCIPSGTPWTGDYAVVPFTRAPDNTPEIPYTINSATFPILLDSGAETTLIQQTALDENHLTPEAVSRHNFAGIGVNDRAMDVKKEEFASVTIGAESFSDVWLTVGNSPNEMAANSLLGEDYLAHHRVFVANSTRTLYLGLAAQPAK